MRNPIENIYIKRVEKKKLFGYALAEARPAGVRRFGRWTVDRLSASCKLRRLEAGGGLLSAQFYLFRIRLKFLPAECSVIRV